MSSVSCAHSISELQNWKKKLLVTLGAAPDAKRNTISAHQQAANTFSYNDFFSSMQKKKVKFQLKLLKLRGHNHQNNFTTKDEFTTKKGIKADTAGTTKIHILLISVKTCKLRNLNDAKPETENSNKI